MRYALLVPALALALVGIDPAGGKAEEAKAIQRTITIEGRATAAAAPDIAEVTIGVVTQSPSAKLALAANTASMTKLFQTVKDLGVAEQDTRTSGFNIAPQYETRERGLAPRIVSYQVANQIVVKFRDIAKLGDALDRVVTDGANIVHGVRFTFDESDAILDEARAKAMADARRKEELYAKGAGVKLGRVLIVTEGGLERIRPVVSEGLMARSGMAQASVPIAPGEQGVHASIVVIWALE